MKSILWIAPNLNHYKARFLNRLSETTELQIVVLAGGKMFETGHKQDAERPSFEQINIEATKRNFHYSLEVYWTIAKFILGRKFDVVLMPLEKKHLSIILFLFMARFLLRFKLISYNHPTVKFKKRNEKYEKKFSKFLFRLYDRIIFYTGQSRAWAVNQKLLPREKAYFANNTLDTESIWNDYTFAVNSSPQKTLLFIGRLIPSKRLDLLFLYYKEIKKKLSDLRLIIIGDGPESEIVKKMTYRDTNVLWRGAVVDEKKIAQDMQQAHAVFIPGHSGLSIVHAFCYGKPYITCKKYKNHPPEIDYLVDGKNGLFLDGNPREDIDRIVKLFKDEESYKIMCKNALNTAKELSITNWCAQIKDALK